MCVKLYFFLEIHNMSEAFLNQVTLDCLLNKNMYKCHLILAILIIPNISYLTSKFIKYYIAAVKVVK